MSEQAGKTAELTNGAKQLDSIRAAIGHGAYFAALSGRWAKVAGQGADKEGKRLRCVFAPQTNHRQTKGGIGYVTVGIIEPRSSLTRGLFTEDHCEDRAKTHCR